MNDIFDAAKAAAHRMGPPPECDCLTDDHEHRPTCDLECYWQERQGLEHDLAEIFSYESKPEDFIISDYVPF